MSILKLIRAQLGFSATPANNFVIRAMDDGLLRISRGNANAESADVLVVNADNTLSVLAAPAQFDSSLKLVTSGFLQSALGNMAGYGGLLNATQALTQTSVGKFFKVSGAVTISLPTPKAALQGATVELLGIDASNSFNVNVTGGTNITAYSSFNAATLVCLAGSPVVFRCDGTQWNVVHGAERYRSDWAKSAGAPGYQKLPSGLIIQYGQFTTNTSGVGTTFPITFPTACMSLVATFIGAINSSTLPVIGLGSMSTTGFNSWSNSATPGCAFMAIGI